MTRLGSPATRRAADAYWGMRSWRPSFLLVMLTAASLAVLVAGCGGSGDAGGQSALPPTELTSFATAAKASASDSARFSLSLSQSLPGSDKTLAFHGSGAFDAAAKRAHVELDLSAVAELIGGLGSALGGSGGANLSTDPDDWQLEAIVEGDVAYLRFPLLAAQLPAGKTWVKGDAKELAGQAGSGLGQFDSFAQTDPREVFAVLQAVSGSIETVGSEELRGVATTHYRASIDLAKALELIPAEQRQGVPDLEQMLGQLGLSQVPIDVWLDAEQRVHKLQAALELTSPDGSGQQARTELSVEVWDYGVPVELELPSSDDVADAASLQHGP
jgi:hypothetical protein